VQLAAFLAREQRSSNFPVDKALGCADQIGQIRLVDNACVLAVGIVVEQEGANNSRTPTSPRPPLESADAETLLRWSERVLTADRLEDVVGR